MSFFRKLFGGDTPAAPPPDAQKPPEPAPERKRVNPKDVLAEKRLAMDLAAEARAKEQRKLAAELREAAMKESLEDRFRALGITLPPIDHSGKGAEQAQKAAAEYLAREDARVAEEERRRGKRHDAWLDEPPGDHPNT